MEVNQGDGRVGGNVPESNEGAPGGWGDAGDDVVQSGGGVVDEHPAVGYPGEVDAVFLNAVGFFDMVEEGPDKDNIVIARRPVTRVDRVTLTAGFVAVNLEPFRSGEHAGRARGTVGPGAVPASPVPPRGGITESVAVDHDEPAVLIVVRHVIQTSSVFLRLSVAAPAVEIKHQRCWNVVS